LNRSDPTFDERRADETADEHVRRARRAILGAERLATVGVFGVLIALAFSPESRPTDG
jgi:hypothetical protein